MLQTRQLGNVVKTILLLCLMFYLSKDGIMLQKGVLADFNGPKAVNWYNCSLFTNTPPVLKTLQKMELNFENDGLSTADLLKLKSVLSESKRGEFKKNIVNSFQDLIHGAGGHLSPQDIRMDDVLELITNEKLAKLHGRSRSHTVMDTTFASTLVQESEKAASTHARCASVDMPLDHANKDGKTIRVFVKAYVPDGKTLEDTTKTLYVLQGGPGGSSDSLEPYMYLLRTYLPDFTIVYLEHRGVGRSDRLGCVAAQAETQNSDGGVGITEKEMPACAEDLAREKPVDFAYYSTTQAANDLLTFIKDIQAAEPSSKTIVYGISYGTFWSGRFLQLDGAAASIDKIILDGIVSQSGTSEHPLDRTQLNQWDDRMNTVGMYLLDTFDKLFKEEMTKLVSNAHLKVGDALYSYTTGREFIADVFKHVYEDNACEYEPEGADKPVSISQLLPKDDLKKVLGTFLINVHNRELIPSILFRLLRCDKYQDVGALMHLAEVLRNGTLSQLSQQHPPRSSEMLYRNIAFSELWSFSNVTFAELRAVFDKSLIATGVYDMAPSYHTFKTYSDAHVGHTYSDLPDLPILLLNGDLDPQTPYDYLAAQYNNTKSSCPLTQKVMIPYAPHFTVMRSPWPAPSGRPAHCGLDLTIQFISNDDASSLDLNCTDYVTPPNFLKPSVSESFFGVEDAFNGRFEPSSGHITVPLELFIAVEAGTLGFSIIVICLLIYCLVSQIEKKKNKQRYEQI